MKLLYATSIVPSGRANRMQVFAMARALGALLKENFWLGARDQVVLEQNVFQARLFKESKSYRLSREYLEFAAEQKIAAIYCREPRLLLFICLWNKFLFRLNLQFVYEVHRIIGDNALNALADYLLSFLVDKYIFVTRHLADMYAKKYGLKKEQIFVAPDGVDLSVFDIDVSKEDARRRLDLPANAILLGYCGRFKTMGEDKGFFGILEALKLLPENIIFAAMGGKPRHVEEFEKIAETKGLGNRAIFRGHEVQSTVALYQKAFDVLLMPFPDIEHYRYFMSPMKMFEYMASKRPIVASDLPSVREVLNDQNTVFIEPDNPQSLVAGIKKLLDDSALGERLANQAYEDVKQYAWEKRAEKVIDFIK